MHLEKTGFVGKQLNHSLMKKLKDEYNSDRSCNVNEIVDTKIVASMREDTSSNKK